MWKVRPTSAVLNVLAAIATLSWAPPASATIVVNGDFSDRLNGWTNSGDWRWDSHAFAYGTGFPVLSQIVSLEPGETYTLEFDFGDVDYFGQPGQTSEVWVFVGGFLFGPVANAHEWTHFSAQFTWPATMTTDANLEFDLQSFWQYRLDNVSITPLNSNSAIPEPQSWMLMLLGFGAAGTMIRRRRVFARLA